MSEPKPKDKPFEISKWVVWEAYQRVKAKGAPRQLPTHAGRGHRRWMTSYLPDAIEPLRADGEAIPDGLLAHLSPIAWEPVHFLSRYAFDPGKLHHWRIDGRCDRAQMRTRNTLDLPEFAP